MDAGDHGTGADGFPTAVMSDVLEVFGRPSPGGGEARWLRCPFARLGIHSTAVEACSGYEALLVRPGGVDAAGEGPEGHTCAHLAPERSARGYFAACHHPDAEIVVPAGRRALRRIEHPARRAG